MPLRPPAADCPWSRSDGATPLTGDHGPVTLVDAFEDAGSSSPTTSCWHAGRPAAEQCEGCTLYTRRSTSCLFLQSRDVTYATICQGPHEEALGTATSWAGQMPWYAADRGSLETPAGSGAG